METGGGDFLTKRRVENVWLYGNSILAESYTGTRADSPCILKIAFQGESLVRVRLLT